MSKHTPAEWSVIPQGDGSLLVARRFETGKQMNPLGLRLIAHVLTRGNSIEQDKANARLIAAAPDLLEALQAVLKAVRRTASTPTTVAEAERQLDEIRAARELADAAIAKATGEEA